MSQGSNIADAVASARMQVIHFGKRVVVDGKDTLEFLNYSFTLRHHDAIDLSDIENHACAHYRVLGRDFAAIQSAEHAEYAKITNELLDKFKLLNDDLRSRRILWTDDCCISMIHFLIRDKIYCFVHFRSSDCVGKLFADVYLIYSIAKHLQQIVNIDEIELRFSVDSLHRILG